MTTLASDPATQADRCVRIGESGEQHLPVGELLTAWTWPVGRSGPNGLGAATVLAKVGVQITVLEAADEIGSDTRSGGPGLPARAIRAPHLHVEW